MNSTSRSLLIALIISLGTCYGVSADESLVSFQSDWKNQNDRVWIGPEYWANPMEDWQLKEGRLECTRLLPHRNVHLLTHRLGKEKGTFECSVILGASNFNANQKGFAGFEIGILSELKDYRSSLLKGKGIQIGVNMQGAIVMPGTKNWERSKPLDSDSVKRGLKGKGVKFAVQVTPLGKHYQIQAEVFDLDSGKSLDRLRVTNVAASKFIGNIALASHPLVQHHSKGKKSTYWFKEWKVSGTKLVVNNDHTFGPILYSMYTLSRGVMKLNVQMPPMGKDDSQEVSFMYANGKQSQALIRSKIDKHSRTALFTIKNWNDKQDISYRLIYNMKNRKGKITPYSFNGTIRKDPVDKETISVAGFTGNTDPAFPNNLLAENVKKQNPDLLLFTGDQIYENVGGYGIIRSAKAENKEKAILNYLRKIYLWGWAFRDVLRDRPSIVLPDDHDVYQGNIWGENGKLTPNGMKDHAKGGYAEHPDFVNMVQRTQTDHHPKPFDATPIGQGITVYYGDMLYGRISFAILEDRKFKSGPEGKVNTWKGRPDHMTDPKYDVKKMDKPGLILLGKRQLKFLDSWAKDWRGADMKTVCSQTIFCNLANYHGVKQEFVVADLDSNGWPQTGRNKAIAAMRKGFAFHYAGDQHLPSITQYGVDKWGDSGFAFCVPSIAAGYPRSWRPDKEGRPVKNRTNPKLANTGDYKEGFGNKVTVYAIGNPQAKNRKPILEKLHDKASGYGLVHFNKKKRTIKMECFKLLFDANNVKPEDQFPGWPLTINMEENYGRKAVAYLPTIEVTGMTNPVVQVIDQSNNEVVYTLRIRGKSFRPKVFKKGDYLMRVGSQETNNMKEAEVSSSMTDEIRKVKFHFSK